MVSIIDALIKYVAPTVRVRLEVIKRCLFVFCFVFFFSFKHSQCDFPNVSLQQNKLALSRAILVPCTTLSYQHHVGTAQT